MLSHVMPEAPWGLFNHSDIKYEGRILLYIPPHPSAVHPLPLGSPAAIVRPVDVNAK